MKRETNSPCMVTSNKKGYLLVVGRDAGTDIFSRSGQLFSGTSLLLFHPQCLVCAVCPLMMRLRRVCTRLHQAAKHSTKLHVNEKSFVASCYPFQFVVFDEL